MCIVSLLQVLEMFVGIVYCVYQKEAEEVACELTKRGIKASCYHANLNAEYRVKVHHAWINNKIQV